jgi:hypothetical protein
VSPSPANDCLGVGSSAGIGPKSDLAGDWFGGAKIPRPEIATKDEYKIALVIGELQTAQNLHQVVNLA